MDIEIPNEATDRTITHGHHGPVGLFLHDDCTDAWRIESAGDDEYATIAMTFIVDYRFTVCHGLFYCACQCKSGPLIKGFLCCGVILLNKLS